MRASSTVSNSLEIRMNLIMNGVHQSMEASQVKGNKLILVDTAYQVSLAVLETGWIVLDSSLLITTLNLERKI